MTEFKHIPVMLEECMQGLNLKDGGIYYDATIGGAGHSYEILKRTAPNGRLIATDLDDEAIEASTKRLEEFDGRFKIFKSKLQSNLLINAINALDKLSFSGGGTMGSQAFSGLQFI